MANATETVVTEPDAAPLQVLTFLLDNEVYANEIAQIQEVLEYRRVTPVPRAPDFMLGVINLRGNVVPVIDLRQQFDMHLAKTTVNTCIVIVDVIVDGEKTAMGILADAVKEVVELPVDLISPPPRIGSRVDTRFIQGMARYEEDFIVILNLPAIFSDQEFETLIEAVQEAGDPGLVNEADPPADA